MYDSAFIDIRCPFCGKTSEIECQTKQLDRCLDVWRKGDFVGDKTLQYLECIADCQSKECMDYKKNIIGFQSGFGRIFYVNIILNEGIITGEYEIKYTSE